MSIEVKIPPVGESITSGLVSTWHKAEGDSVAEGDVLLTLETDKVSTEITADAAGVLKIIVPEGEEVDIGTVVATIDPEGGAPASEAQAKPEADKGSAKEPVKEHVPAPAPVEEPAAARAPEAPAPSQEQAPAQAAPKLSSTSLVPASAPATPATVPAQEGRTTRKRMSPLRRKIAAQLVMAQQTAAMLTTFNEADMSGVMGLRKRLQEEFVAQHGVKLGFMSFFIKASVHALKAVPGVNSRIDGEDLITNHFYDIGVAVGTERGLIVPVIRDADQKSFAEIEKDIIEYAGKAREGKIKVEDLQGGVFTISNGGVYGSLLSTPILNPPQSGILGLHKIQERPIAEKGQVVIRPMMNLALSYDHRVIDGKEAVTFLIKIKEAIEDPMRLLLDF